MAPTGCICTAHQAPDTSHLLSLYTRKRLLSADPKDAYNIQLSLWTSSGLGKLLSPNINCIWYPFLAVDPQPSQQDFVKLSETSKGVPHRSIKPSGRRCPGKWLACSALQPSGQTASPPGSASPGRKPSLRYPPCTLTAHLPLPNGGFCSLQNWTACMPACCMLMCLVGPHCCLEQPQAPHNALSKQPEQPMCTRQAWQLSLWAVISCASCITSHMTSQALLLYCKQQLRLGRLSLVTPAMQCHSSRSLDKGCLLAMLYSTARKSRSAGVPLLRNASL